ncbi:DUF2971 domain-containing protein [Pseudomonas viridiflava]|uniref:DUF2971 domain-containing protein n=1 Tax=Pseudomonas viridiflava TaxID=33069 RepID=UPI002EA8C910|nr:DUF2971 domain-containing protein [Pseudomonas viridiflava]
MSTPPYLYKYQKVTEHSLLSLVEGTVWMASPDSFNDPFDCAINLDQNKLSESVAHALDLVSKARNAPVDESLSAVRPEDETAYAELRASLKAQIQAIGVLCLSETPCEILMWSHYAQNHKGFCIEYSVDESSLLRAMAQPVRYTDAYPSLSVKNLPGDAEQNFLDVCLYTKAKQWSYEKEWRVISPVGGKLYRAPAPVSAVIFGARMPETEKRDIYELLRPTNSVQFREAFMLEDGFSIGIRPYARSASI